MTDREYCEEYELAKKTLRTWQENRSELGAKLKEKGIDVDVVIARLERCISEYEQSSAQISALRARYGMLVNGQRRNPEQAWSSAGPPTADGAMVGDHDDRHMKDSPELRSELALTKRKRKEEQEA